MESRRLAAKAPIALAVPEQARRFSSVVAGPGLDELLQELRRSAAETQLRPIDHVSQILLGADGRTAGGFRYSVNALRQLCRLLGRGFSQTLFDLGAVVASQAKPDEGPYDPSLMINLLNDVIRLRFEQRLKSYALIADVQEKRIDGLVGTRYAYLSNSAFFDRVQAVLKPTGVQFHEAVLTNRRMTIRYRSSKPIFALTDQDPTETFFGGFHFGNSEVGDSSVKIAVLLIRQRGDAKAVSEFSGRGRLMHIRGPQFNERLGEQLAAVMRRAGEPLTLQPKLRAMRTRSLNLVGGEEELKKKTAALNKRLQQWGLHRSMALRVVNRVKAFGSALASDAEGAKQTRARQPDRTEWDLFNAMTFVAKRLLPDAQERLEQLAYQMVLGKKTLS